MSGKPVENSLGGRRLLSVPEETTLKITVGEEDNPSDDSKSADEATNDAEIHEQEAVSAVPITEIKLLPEAGKLCVNPEAVTKAEPVTASKQISLWILRTSTQDIHQEWSAVGSIKNMIGMGAPGQDTLVAGSRTKEENVLRKCATDIKFRIESDCEDDDHENDSSPVSDERRRNYKKSPRSNTRDSLLKQFKMKARNKNQQLKLSRNLPFQSTAPGKLCNMNSLSSLSSNLHTMSSNLHSGGGGLVPINRFRSRSSNIQCSRCSLVQSSCMTSRSTSQMSLLLDKQNQTECKICLMDSDKDKMVTLNDCKCQFCEECLVQYTSLEIMSGSYNISCPDPQCQNNGVVSVSQLYQLVDRDLVEKHKMFRLNTEVTMDTSRTWCPAPDCHTICHVCPSQQVTAVTCPTCVMQFCSGCQATWHPGLTCEEYGTQLVNTEYIKRCPMCRVPIEREAGCAQMMCRRCKHVFCWYCMASLDGDFLLRHYDSGECRGKLGHSRASVVLHRLQVVGIFAIFGVLLLIASPLILIMAPVIICCKCGCCCFKTAK